GTEPKFWRRASWRGPRGGSGRGRRRRTRRTLAGGPGCMQLFATWHAAARPGAGEPSEGRHDMAIDAARLRNRVVVAVLPLAVACTDAGQAGGVQQPPDLSKIPAFSADSAYALLRHQVAF